MSDLRLYTVALSDLGAYTSQIVACSEDEAVSIAATVLHEAFKGAPGLAITGRETDGQATLAETQPKREFRVQVTFQHIHAVTLPADSSDEACTHFGRLIEENCGPWEFEQVDARPLSFKAEEVRS